ncbi:MAG: BolA family transcriptional regulator [Xanthomonadales bacterium]|nr:BolA family transcriptional regulator [Xanthomonadales bacterium]MCB1627843.1 BolA family transcriptional regulator [Xanthomonadales bacterium]
MSGADRLARIEALLRQALEPTELEIVDEGHLHVGHAGARDGRGHFRVRLVSERFSGQSPLARHRLVYAALGDMLDSDIHALALKTLAPEEL